MTTSATYNFNPSLGELTLYAFNLVGLRPTAITQEHMAAARMAANLTLSRWSAKGVNLWAVDLQTITPVQGTATYTVPSNTIAMLDTYVTTGSGSGTTNRLIMPISRSEYASYPNPAQQGFPSTYWFDRLLSPTVTFWPTPDGNESLISYYRVRQIQDSQFADATTVEVPVYFLDAFALAMAWRLALIWAPSKVDVLKTLAEESYMDAASQNVETAQQYISPMITSYYRP
jgi:hypothetical protein